MVKTIHLPNIKINRLTDKNLNYYYLIRDNNSDDVYFVFESALKVKSDWAEMEKNWEELPEVKIEYETGPMGNNKVLNVITFQEEEQLFI